MDETWQAIAREAGLGAEHLAIGITALGRSNYAQQAYYAQAFFALSVGFERSAKLALVIDHALANAGEFPSSKVLKGYGHDIENLLHRVDSCAGTYTAERLPQTEIHKSIIEILTQFATNVTRYYNLDLITGRTQAPSAANPISEWFGRVTLPILDAHYHPARRSQICRFLAELFFELSFAANHARIEAIPYLEEFYAIFMNSDKYFRERKTWSIHGDR